MMSASDAMSANVKAQYSTSTSNSSSGSVVRPQPVTERSLMESVAGFISEVQVGLQQTTSSSGASSLASGTFSHAHSIGQLHESKASVTWARFETADINDPRLFPEGSEINGNYPPLLLVLGYTQGVQIWLVSANGEAQEVLSWKQGSVKTLRVLPSPEENCFGFPDNFAHCRPLIALADSTGPGTAFTTATFISLKTGEQVHNIKFNSEIADLTVNRRVVVAAFREKLAVFDACTLREPRFTITTCYASPGVHVNPIALGDRWLAYADQRLMPLHRSSGGMETDGSQSVAAWGIHVGSKLAQGVSKFYSNFFSSPASGSMRQAIPNSPKASRSDSISGAQGEPQKGVITILDTLGAYKADAREEMNVAERTDGVVAHFIAHNKAIVALEFDSTGTLLLTCDRAGNYFNLFRIVPHPAGSCYTAVHHLYSLYRGDTPGSVQDVAFSPDSRWVAVSTLRGTTHIFPVTPYGGPVGVRTHTAPRVVNRLSRFHRSAGFDDTFTTTQPTTSSGRNSPNPHSSYGTSPLATSHMKSAMSGDPTPSPSSGGSSSGLTPAVLPYPIPHIPPFPSPTLVQPLAQLRQPYLLSLTSQTLGTASSVGRKKSQGGSSSSHAASSSSSGTGGASNSEEQVPIRLAACFASSRAWLTSGGQHNVYGRLSAHHAKKAHHDALYVMANHGVLLEYTLEPVADSTLPKEKICESSPIELRVNPFGQWSLLPPRDRAELQPPLPVDNPLMLPLAAKVSALSSCEFLPHISDDDRWLSQVEIVTHVGPHRRLWMGPQFAFKIFQNANAGEGDSGTVLCDLDIGLTNRPEQSNPMNIHGKMPVLIEAGSASSFELSPRFSNAFSGRHHSTGSREAVLHQNELESELQEAMSEVVNTEESLLDGAHSLFHHKNIGKRMESGYEEEFFCLTPESSRSRNASSTSNALPLSVTLPDTKIFSVAVEAGSASGTSASTSKLDNLRVCDVDEGFSGHFAVVSRSQTSEEQNTPKSKTQEISRQSSKMPDKEVVASGEKTKSKKKKKGGKSAAEEPALLGSMDGSHEQDEQRGTELLLAEAMTSVKAIKDSTPPRNVWNTNLKLAAATENNDDSEFSVMSREVEPGADKQEEASETGEPQHTAFGFLGDFELKSGFGEDGDDDGDFKPTFSGSFTPQGNEATAFGDQFFKEDKSSSSANMADQEGWSFEADDLDVDRLISEVTSDKGKDEITSLDDVFKFDSELALASPGGSSSGGDVGNSNFGEQHDGSTIAALLAGRRKLVKKTLSLEDLEDALVDEANTTDSESDAPGLAVNSKLSARKMVTSLNVTFDEDNLISSEAARETLGTLTAGTSASESSSSVGNSPNPRKVKGKSKKKKKR